jgi:hypothetical protein
MYSRGGRMKERVFAYGADKEVIQFLQSFFKRRKNLRAEFVDDIASLKERVSQSK